MPDARGGDAGATTRGGERVVRAGGQARAGQGPKRGSQAPRPWDVRGGGRGGESGRMGPGGASVVLEGSRRPEAAALAGLQGARPGCRGRIPAAGSGFPTAAAPCQQHPQLEGWAGRQWAGLWAVGPGHAPASSRPCVLGPLAFPLCASAFCSVRLLTRPKGHVHRARHRPAPRRQPHPRRPPSLPPAQRGGQGPARSETHPAACDGNGASVGPRDAGRAATSQALPSDARPRGPWERMEQVLHNKQLGQCGFRGAWHRV